MLEKSERDVCSKIHKADALLSMVLVWEPEVVEDS